MATLDPAATAWFSRHIVTLEMVYTVKHKDKPHEQARAYYTGFLLYEKGATVWVTAGHCLEEIERDVLGNPEHYGNVKFRFIDILHSRVVSNLPVPFGYKAKTFESYLFHRNDEGIELGWDFGIVFLHPHHVRLLLSNNITPVDAANWIATPDTFDLYYMLGLPSERVQQLNPNLYTGRPAMFSITELEERPSCFDEQTDPMFYAEIDANSEVENIQGMSGGPILGMKADRETETVRYWFIGVQSKWKHGRVIAASPLSELRDLLSKAMDVASNPNADGTDYAYDAND